MGVSYTFIKARWFTPTGGRRIDLVVLHTAETPEGVNTARAVANYFATTTTKASAHYTVDPKNIFQCVQDKDVAYAAPGANSNGIHLELSGRAGQTAGEWHDTYSSALLANAAKLAADICAAYKIPARYVPAAQLAAGGAAARGITTHNEVSKAFRKSTHWDPGPNFPIIEFVNAVLGGTPPAPTPPPTTTPRRNTMKGIPVRSYPLRIPTDAVGDGSAPACAVDKFISAVPYGGHDKYSGDADTTVAPIGAHDAGGTMKLTVAAGPKSSEVWAWVTEAD